LRLPRIPWLEESCTTPGLRLEKMDARRVSVESSIRRRGHGGAKEAKGTDLHDLVVALRGDDSQVNGGLDHRSCQGSVVNTEKL